jgi:hypothetical protein
LGPIFQREAHGNREAHPANQRTRWCSQEYPPSHDQPTLIPHALTRGWLRLEARAVLLLDVERLKRRAR